MPGCAFTRSIGDRVAKSIGVIPWPETLELEIDTSHEYAATPSCCCYSLYVACEGMSGWAGMRRVRRRLVVVSACRQLLLC